MPTDLEYAQLSLHAYAASDENRTPLPKDWHEIMRIPDDVFGFSAGVYQKGSEIVIGFDANVAPTRGRAGTAKCTRWTITA